MWFCFYKSVYSNIIGEGETPEAAFNDANSQAGDPVNPQECKFFAATEMDIEVKTIFHVRGEVVKT